MVFAPSPDYLHVAHMMLTAQGIPRSFAVLMTAYTPQWIETSVQEKALLWVNGEVTASKSYSDRISAFQFRFSCIEVRVIHTIPQNVPWTVQIPLLHILL